MKDSATQMGFMSSRVSPRPIRSTSKASTRYEVPKGSERSRSRSNNGKEKGMKNYQTQRL